MGLGVRNIPDDGGVACTLLHADIKLNFNAFVWENLKIIDVVRDLQVIHDY